MRKLEEMEARMRLDDLKQKGGISDEKKKSKKPAPVVELIDLDLLQKDVDRLYLQIYAYFSVSDWENRREYTMVLIVAIIISTLWKNGRRQCLLDQRRKREVEQVKGLP
jgi:hypothetical protein